MTNPIKSQIAANRERFDGKINNAKWAFLSYGRQEGFKDHITPAVASQGVKRVLSNE